MKDKQQTFAELLQSFGYRYDLRPVFDDFLTMAICACSQNPLTRKSHYEDLYMEMITKYAKDETRHIFPKMFGALVCEMEDRKEASLGNDVLGEAYELNFCRKGAGQFFTPPPICDFMAASLAGNEKEREKTLRILDPSCGSGRMLLAGARLMGKEHRYYGIDIDLTCVKMAIINLFLNGVFHAEVMCADALRRDDFRISYYTSFLPFGIFMVVEKEKSGLWHMYNATFKASPPEPKLKQEIILPSKEVTPSGNGIQMQLF